MKSISDDFQIYKYKILNWQEKKYKLIELFYKTKPRIYGNVFTIYNNGEQNRFFLNSKIQKILMNDIEKFLTDIKDIDDNEYLLYSSWMQLYKKNMSHEIHNHGLGYSAIIYLKFDKEIHSSTVFVDKKTINDTEKLYKPEIDEGDIIFFNSRHYHYCPTNENDKERMICSFNLKKDFKISYS